MSTIRSRITGRPGIGRSSTGSLSSFRLVMQASPFLPLMFIAPEPQTPSRHERRNASVSSCAFNSISAPSVGRYDRCLGDLDQVVDLERLAARGIERHALVLARDTLYALLELLDPGHAFGQELLVAINPAVRLHRSAQGLGDFRNLLAR